MNCVMKLKGNLNTLLTRVSLYPLVYPQLWTLHVEKPQKECKELAKEHLQGDISLEKDRRIGLLKGWPKNPPHQDQSSTKGMNIESQRFTLFAKAMLMAQDTGYFVSGHRRKSGIVGSVAMKVSRSALLLETSKTDLGSIRQRQCMTATLSTGHRCTRQGADAARLLSHQLFSPGCRLAELTGQRRDPETFSSQAENSSGQKLER
ncbi:hypothetical protein WJX82_006840 [Trebouxia sp. C0006]